MFLLPDCSCWGLRPSSAPCLPLCVIEQAEPSWHAKPAMLFHLLLPSCGDQREILPSWENFASTLFIAAVAGCSLFGWHTHSWIVNMDLHSGESTRYVSVCMYPLWVSRNSKAMRASAKKCEPVSLMFHNNWITKFEMQKPKCNKIIN